MKSRKRFLTETILTLIFSATALGSLTAKAEPWRTVAVRIEPSESLPSAVKAGDDAPGESETRIALIGEARNEFRARLVVYKADPNQNFATVRVAAIPVIIQTSGFGLQALISNGLRPDKGFVNFKGHTLREVLGDYKGVEIEAGLLVGGDGQFLINRSGIILANAMMTISGGAGLGYKAMTIKTNDEIGAAVLDMNL